MRENPDLGTTSELPLAAGRFGALARNTITIAITPLYPLTVLSRPAPIQQKAFNVLGRKLEQ